MLYFAREAIMLSLKIGLPTLMAALIIGLIIALFQTLTQIQEMTLAFVPKIVAVFLVLYFTAPYMGRLMADFGAQLGDALIAIE